MVVGALDSGLEGAPWHGLVAGGGTMPWPSRRRGLDSRVRGLDVCHGPLVLHLSLVSVAAGGWGRDQPGAAAGQRPAYKSTSSRVGPLSACQRGPAGEQSKVHPTSPPGSALAGPQVIDCKFDSWLYASKSKLTFQVQPLQRKVHCRIARHRRGCDPAGRSALHKKSRPPCSGWPGHDTHPARHAQQQAWTVREDT